MNPASKIKKSNRRRDSEADKQIVQHSRLDHQLIEKAES